MYFSRIKEINEELYHIAERKKRLEEELAALKEQSEKEPDLPRVKFNNNYYTIRINFLGENISRETETLDNANDADYKKNIYFPPEHKDFAEEVADKFKFILFLARQKMIYCPDYKPDWNDDKGKWVVYFDHYCNKFCVGTFNYCETKEIVYFPTAEIAQKVCDKLNSELRKEV